MRLIFNIRISMFQLFVFPNNVSMPEANIFTCLTSITYDVRGEIDLDIWTLDILTHSNVIINEIKLFIRYE